MIQEIIDKVVKEGMFAQERLIVDDIINIYNGKYEDYSLYMSEKRNLVKFREKQNEMNFRLEPFCIAEPTFNYIKIKGEKK